MAVATFDTLKFANTLKSAGVPDKQAEAQAMAFAEIIHVNMKDLATKDDLNQLKTELTAKIDTSVAKVQGELAILRWMVGFGVLGTISIFIRIFFSRGAI